MRKRVGEAESVGKHGAVSGAGDGVQRSVSEKDAMRKALVVELGYEGLVEEYVDSFAQAIPEDEGERIELIEAIREYVYCKAGFFLRMRMS